jgi:hypothetical protein
MDVQGISLLNFSLPAVWTCTAWVSLSPPPTLAVWACRVYPFCKCRNVGLSGIQSVRYRNEQKCRCRNQSGTEIRGPSSVPECSGTGDTGCRNADAGGIDLDADAQLWQTSIYLPYREKKDEEGGKIHSNYCVS